MSISIQEVSKEFVKDFEGEVEAVAIIAVGNGRSAVSITGIDPLGIAPRSIMLVDVMQTILNTKLSVANALCEKMKEEGIFSSTVDLDRETTIREQDATSRDNASAERNESQALKDEADEVFDMLANLLKGVAGVVEKEVAKHADDD